MHDVLARDHGRNAECSRSASFGTVSGTAVLECHGAGLCLRVRDGPRFRQPCFSLHPCQRSPVHVDVDRRGQRRCTWAVDFKSRQALPRTARVGGCPAAGGVLNVEAPFWKLEHSPAGCCCIRAHVDVCTGRHRGRCVGPADQRIKQCCSWPHPDSGACRRSSSLAVAPRTLATRAQTSEGVHS